MIFNQPPEQVRRAKGLPPVEGSRENEPNIMPIVTLLIVLATDKKRFPGARHQELLSQEDLKLALGMIEDITTIDWDSIEPHQLKGKLDEMFAIDSQINRKIQSLLVGLSRHTV